MPWLLGLILLHGYNKEKNLELKDSIYTIFFSFIIFISSLISLFFVRSGFLNSVHAFVNDYTSGIFFLVLLFVLIFYIIYLFNSYQKYSRPTDYILSIYSNQGSLFLMINIIIIFFLILTFGTFYPIIYNIFTNQDLSLNMAFYNDSLKLLMIPFLFLFLNKHMTKYNHIFMNVKSIYFFLGFSIVFFSFCQ
jgi:cytochrome c-type biogenesis protein CcmF